MIGKVHPCSHVTRLNKFVDMSEASMALRLAVNGNFFKKHEKSVKRGGHGYLDPI